MYRVSYYTTGSNLITHREFQSLTEAMNFAIQQPTNSVFEIKLLELKTSYDNK